jgi:predicted ABC-type ATPase
MLERIEALARQRADFGFETTLAGRGWLPLLERLRGQGYRLNMFFLWLPTPELAVSRVEERVRAGGHSVPETIVRRRFRRGLRNFFEIYRSVLDGWLVLDNSEEEPRIQEETNLACLSEKAHQAMKEAVKASLTEHWRAGRLVYIFCDGQIMAISESRRGLGMKV